MINITEVTLPLAPNYSDSTNDPSNKRLLVVSCNKCGKIDSGELFCIETYLMFHIPVFLAKLDMDFQEFLRDFSNTKSTEMNGTFAPSCLSLCSLSLRYYFHWFCTSITNICSISQCTIRLGSFLRCPNINTAWKLGKIKSGCSSFMPCTLSCPQAFVHGGRVHQCLWEWNLPGTGNTPGS